MATDHCGLARNHLDKILLGLASDAGTHFDEYLSIENIRVDPEIRVPERAERVGSKVLCGSYSQDELLPPIIYRSVESGVAIYLVTTQTGVVFGQLRK
jgi:hypothetical protein